MFPDWFTALVRNTFTTRPLRPETRSRALLHLEGLEDRALLSIAFVEPPAWWSLTDTTGTREETRVVSVDDPAVGDPRTVRVHFGPAGLVRLLDDLGGYDWLGGGPPPSAAPPNDPAYGESDGSTGGSPSPPVPASPSVILVQAPGLKAHPNEVRLGADTPPPSRPEPEPAKSPPTPNPVAVLVPRPVVIPSVARGAPETAVSSAPAVSPTVTSNAAPSAVTRPSPISDEVPLRQPTAPAIARPLPVTSTPDSAGMDCGGLRTPAVNADARPAAVGATDGVLLRRFAVGREQAAFTELVQRHGGSVQAVCARVLGDADLARDASQATFLALARRAGALDDRGSLAGWLHLVARRVALRYRAAAARQRRVEQVAAELHEDADDPLFAVDDEDLFRILREELERLPEKYRLPLTLCYLDGQTHAEVAEAVGLPRGSVAKRIGEGLERLRESLAARRFLL